MTKLPTTISYALSLTLTLALAGACGSSDDKSGNDTGTGGSGNGSGGSGGGGTDPNDVQPGQLCARLASIQCAGEAKCCPNPGRTVADCETAQKASCDQLAFDDAAKDPITGFDQAKAKAAFEAFEQKASKCDVSIAEFAASANSLRGSATGTVASGGTCTPKDMGAPSSIAAALASCKDPSTTACLPAQTGDWTCTARGGAGSPCFTDVNCTDGLYCDNPDLNIAGSTCKARKAAGETCKLANECASIGCADGKCLEKSVTTAYCLGG
jgi:hypothetical protein